MLVQRLKNLVPRRVRATRPVRRLARLVNSGRAKSARNRPRPKTPARLVNSPVFILCSVRSGSTLLRVILNSHSKVCSPHELHLRYLRVRVERAFAEKSVDLLGMDVKELENLLWDRVLERELNASGKSVLVDKTPTNTLDWPRLLECWPDARFIFLLRHPASIVASYMRGHDDRTVESSTRHIGRFVEAIEDARAKLPGLTVRYEDLTSDPETVSRELCSFLGVPWERGMLDYGKQDHGPFKSGVGDWSKNIRSGRIQPARELPPLDDAPEELRRLCQQWGYLS